MYDSYRKLIGEIIMRYIIGNQKEYLKDQVIIHYRNIDDKRVEVDFEADEKYGTITYWINSHIIEEQLFSAFDHQSIFYLHYEINDIAQCHHLFLEFYRCLIKKRANRRYRVLISCTTGLTSCLFASKLQEQADIKNVNIRVDATGYENMNAICETYDLLLLAPQVAHRKKELVKSINSPIDVHRIPAGDYGMMNINHTFEYILDKGMEKKIITL